MSEPTSGGALRGVRVLDLTWGPVGAIATMVLADHGAEVVRVDRPGGDPARSACAFATWDRGKHSAVLDLNDPGDLHAVRALGETADVVVEGLGLGRADSLGLGYDSLRGVNPGLVYCAISSSGPEVEDPMMAHDLLAAARFGVMAETGGVRPGPVFPGHPAATYAAGLLAAIGTLACLRARLVSGHGDRVDVSNIDGVLALSTMEWWSERGISFIRAKLMNNRLDLGRRALLLQHFTCSDGAILQVNTAAPGAFDRAMAVFGISDRISVVGKPPGTELSAADLAVLAEELPAIIAARPLNEWLELLWSNSVACLPLQPAGEFFDDDQVRFSGVVQRTDHPDLGSIEVVGPVVTLSESPAPSLGPIEAIGTSTERARSGWSSRGLGPGRAGTAGPPLQGVRILELSSFFASPYGNRLLADLGAEVIKLEPPGGDPQRGLPDPAENVNARKRSIIVDLKKPDAAPVIQRLVEWADLVGHNMRPGSIDRLGVGVSDVRSMNPSAIYLYGPGYGSAGPKSALQSFAPLHSGLVGLMHLAAGEGNDPVVPFGNEDYYTGLVSAVGALLALIHRDRTGAAQYVEVPQLLATVFAASEFFRVDGELKTSLGRLDAAQMGWSPYLRLYQCGDGWLCISALDAASQLALRQLAAVAEGESDDLFITRLAETFAKGPAAYWRSELLGLGVACEVARDEPWLGEYLNDPSNLASGRSVEINTEAHGRVRVIGNLFRLVGGSRLAADVRAPTPGEHSLAVIRELGFDDEQCSALLTSGAVS